ncbi:MAG: serine hydrolase domain-containing protein [Ginsengibacter sp.]
MRVKGIGLSVFLIVIIINATKIYSQSIPDSTARKIDSLFKTWDNNNSPGCAIGIIRNDSLIYAKGYGMANLEYGIPVTAETIFHMASISKQFTAYSIVLLAREGKLQLDDDIRKHLSWFPDLKEKITIRNLLNHTSGIRDQWQLLAISGTRLDDVITQEHIVKILGRQEALNFSPGEQYSYSNSGFTTLAEIVRSVSGQSLRQFTDSAIFKPLGMNNTHFHDDYTEIVKNRSYSYERKDSAHYKNSILSYSNVGATSLFTNINDMSKWIMNFYDHKVGDQKDIDLLTLKGKLNSGKELSYASGIVSDTYNGWRQFSHGGADAGYRTYVTVFPDLKMGFVIFSNLGDFNPGGKVYDIAGLFVRDTSKHKDLEMPKTPDSSKAFLKDTITIKKFTGSYISDDGMQLGFRLVNKKLYADAFGRSFLLLKKDKDTFSLFIDPGVKLSFSSNASGDTSVFAVVSSDEKHVLKKYIADTSQPDHLLQAYTGTYYCPELDCKYGISLKDHHLLLTNNKYDDTPLTLVGADHLINDFWWMGHLKIIRNNKNDITGFEVNNGRVMHLKFNKL